MPSDTRSSPGRARPIGRGFTLIELIVVITIAAIVSAIGVGSLNSGRQARQRAAARLLAADIAYARERAIALGHPTWVYLYTNTERADYYETINGVLTAITNSATNTQFCTLLGSSSYDSQFSEVGVLTVNGATSASAIILGFDWQGRPTDSGGTLLNSNWTITINESDQTSVTLTISAETGLITITW